jgi:hypothetical protein
MRAVKLTLSPAADSSMASNPSNTNWLALSQFELTTKRLAAADPGDVGGDSRPAFLRRGPQEVGAYLLPLLGLPLLSDAGVPSLGQELPYRCCEVHLDAREHAIQHRRLEIWDRPLKLFRLPQ